MSDFTVGTLERLQMPLHADGKPELHPNKTQLSQTATDSKPGLTFKRVQELVYHVSPDQSPRGGEQGRAAVPEFTRSATEGRN